MSNIDLKALWQQPTPEPPAVQTVINAAQRFQRRELLQLLFTNIALLATCVFIAWIWWFYQPTYWTTKLGIMLVIFAMVLFIGFSTTLLPLLLKEDKQLSNQAYLVLLQQLERQKNKLQTRIMTAYFLLLSLGLALYFYEYTLLMPIHWALLCYGLTALWIAFNWFYLRPRILKKQKAQLSKLQAQFKALKMQFTRD